MFLASSNACSKADRTREMTDGDVSMMSLSPNRSQNDVPDVPADHQNAFRKIRSGWKLSRQKINRSRTRIRMHVAARDELHIVRI